MAYKMMHPDSEQVIEVEKDSVKNYEAQGWTTKAPSPSDK